MSETVITSVAEFHERTETTCDRGSGIPIPRPGRSMAGQLLGGAATDQRSRREIQNVSFRTLIGYLESSPEPKCAVFFRELTADLERFLAATSRGGNRADRLHPPATCGALVRL